LPNLLTLGALFSGFYAIIAGMGGDFNAAGWAILVASIFDGLDGRVARLTGTQSAFGAQFDSLSDMVSFGMAPALIAFSWALSSLGNPGWAAAFIFMSCAALRLARFNVQLGTVSKRFFVGLQSPVAAGLVTFCVWVGALYEVQVSQAIAYLLAVVTVLAGLLMVSNYRYFSFKELHFKGTVPYVVFLMVAALLVLIAQNPHETLLAMCVLYATSGPVLWIYRRQGRDAGKSPPGESPATESGAVSSAQEQGADLGGALSNDSPKKPSELRTQHQEPKSAGLEPEKESPGSLFEPGTEAASGDASRRKSWQEGRRKPGRRIRAVATGYQDSGTVVTRWPRTAANGRKVANRRSSKQRPTSHSLRKG
jgi:CDP-diacylglycerol--serine O-phosphatidyltransferase